MFGAVAADKPAGVVAKGFELTMTSDRIKEDCEFMLGGEGTGVPGATQLPEGEFEFSVILRPFKMIPQSICLTNAASSH